MVSHLPDQLGVDDLILRRERVTDADLVAATVRSNLDHLTPWMGWAGPTAAEPDTIRARLVAAERLWMAGQQFTFLLIERPEATLLGAFGLHRRVGPGAIELGYWLTSKAVGRGYATRAARVLTDAALTLDDVDRVEIRCDEANVRSKAIPARLGYRLDRVEKDAVEAPREVGRNMVWIYP